MADPVPAALYFPRQELKAFGFSEPLIRALEAAARVGQLIVRADNTDAALDLKQPLNGNLTGLAELGTDTGLVEQTGVEAYAIRAIGVAAGDDIPTTGDADGRYVRQDVGSAWAAPTATQSRADLADYASPTISNPPTQAEVQAISDALQATVRGLAAVIADGRANGMLHE